EAGTLEAAAGVTRSLYAQLDRLSKVPPVAERFADTHVVDVGCTGTLAHYCANVYEAVRFGLAHHKKMLVVTQPYLSDRHREQQAQLRAMLAARFVNNRDVGYADLG